MNSRANRPPQPIPTRVEAPGAGSAAIAYLYSPIPSAKRRADSKVQRQRVGFDSSGESRSSLCHRSTVISLPSDPEVT